MAKFEANIVAHLGGFAPKKSIGIVKNSFYEWLERYLGVKSGNNGLIKMQTAYINSRKVDGFNELLVQVVELYKPIEAAEVNTKLKEEWYDWEVIAKEMHNSELETAFGCQLSII